MLNLNLSLLTLTFLFFTRLVLLCLFQIFNDLFFCCSQFVPESGYKSSTTFITHQIFQQLFSIKKTDGCYFFP